MFKRFIIMALLSLAALPIANAKEEDKIVVVVATLDVKESHIDDFKKIAKDVIAAIRKEEGCIMYDLLQDSYDPTKFTFYEEYVDMEAFKRHGKSPHLATFRELRAPFLGNNKGHVKVYNSQKVAR